VILYCTAEIEKVRSPCLIVAALNYSVFCTTSSFVFLMILGIDSNYFSSHYSQISLWKRRAFSVSLKQKFMYVLLNEYPS
jgi:hypothetical protein